jgi:hypothetical protein
VGAGEGLRERSAIAANGPERGVLHDEEAARVRAKEELIYWQQRQLSGNAKEGEQISIMVRDEQKVGGWGRRSESWVEVKED